MASCTTVFQVEPADGPFRGIHLDYYCNILKV